MDDRLLRTYVNDQLALGVLWCEAARRAECKNRGTDVGGALGRSSAGDP